MPNTTIVSGPNGVLQAGESVATFAEVITANAGTSSAGSAPVLTALGAFISR